MTANTKRMTDEEISLAAQATTDVLPLGHTEWEFEAAFARAIEAATEKRVRRECAEIARKNGCHRPSCSAVIALAIESGGSHE